jgi:hypothetical protein
MSNQNLARLERRARRYPKIVPREHLTPFTTTFERIVTSIWPSPTVVSSAALARDPKSNALDHVPPALLIAPQGTVKCGPAARSNLLSKAGSVKNGFGLESSHPAPASGIPIVHTSAFGPATMLT